MDEAGSALVSAISFLQSNTDPLAINQVHEKFISDVFEELMEAKILTEDHHLSNSTRNILDRHYRLKVHHAFGLLKGIILRMKGDDRIPRRWRTMMSEPLAKMTKQKLHSELQSDDIIETLSLMVDNISGEQASQFDFLSPDKSLLQAFRQIHLDENWNGIPVDVKMENLGHVLSIAQSL